MVEPHIPSFRLPRPVRRVVERFARVVCPPELGTLCSLDDLIEELELHLAAMPPHLRAGIEGSFLFFDQGARLWWPARGQRFTLLDDERAETYFVTFARGGIGPQRKLAQILKGLVTLAYYEMPGVKASLEYHPDAYIAQVAKRRLESYADDIRRGEAAVREPESARHDAARDGKRA